MPPLMTAASTFGMPWRENFGIVLTMMGNKKKKDKDSIGTYLLF